MDTQIFNSPAASGSSSARSVSAPAVRVTASSTAILEPPSTADVVPDALSIFSRTSNQSTSSLDIDSLQDQVQQFMQKYERTQSGKEAGPSTAVWDDTFSVSCVWFFSFISPNLPCLTFTFCSPAHQPVVLVLPRAAFSSTPLGCGNNEGPRAAQYIHSVQMLLHQAFKHLFLSGYSSVVLLNLLWH